MFLESIFINGRAQKLVILGLEFNVLVYLIISIYYIREIMIEK
jgi:hypothetical protein